MRKAGKSYEQYLDFISQIKIGRKGLIFAPDYVVMDKQTYEDLIKKRTKKRP